MNRPSRTEDDFEHPTWNQNPPFLAPDLTTRQDLNGIANSRVHRSGASGAGAGAAQAGMLDEKQMGDMASQQHARRLATPATGGWPKWLAEPSVAQITELGGEGQALFSLRSIQSQSWGWICWIASVVVVSTVINMAGRYVPALFTSTAGGKNLAVESVGGASTTLRQLSRRGNTCGAGNGPSVEYNTPLHVGALLIILFVSSLACATPLLALRFPILRIPEAGLFAFRHFGTGVLLATAFVHLLPTAFISLGNPCLSNFWTTDYPAMPGAIALAGIFFVSIIEMIFSPARHYSVTAVKKGDNETSENLALETRPPKPSGGGGHCGHADVAAIITRPANRERGDSNVQQTTTALSQGESSSGEEESLHHRLTPEQLHKKAILQCMLLEVGILFHSVFIGMALSVSVGGDFVVLLIAIAFHQTFEGLALGARIATIKWPEKTLQPYLMVLAYGCTTPIGQAIGLATHTLYSPDSEFGLVLVGTMNAISSGLLVFASLIELLAEDFLSDHSWVVLRSKRRVIACVLVFGGAVSMSIVGAWA